VDSCRRLVREVIIEPRADMKYDQSGDFPHDVFKALWEAGMLHLEFPEWVGGPGLGCLDDVIVQEEIHYGCIGISTSVMANQLAAMPLIIGAQEAGKEALAKKYLGMLLEEPRYAAYCCSE